MLTQSYQCIVLLLCAKYTLWLVHMHDKQKASGMDRHKSTALKRQESIKNDNVCSHSKRKERVCVSLKETCVCITKLQYTAVKLSGRG